MTEAQPNPHDRSDPHRFRGVSEESERYLRLAGVIGSPELIGKIRGEEVWMSVQAGSFAFSKPRRVLEPGQRYTHLEIALIASGRIVHPNQIGVLGSLKHYWEGKPAVARFVPVEKVAEVRRSLLDAAKAL